MTEQSRFYARVPRGVEPRTVHTWPERRMPPARALLIAPTPDGYAVIRWDDRGDFAGDTWHRSLDDAREQVAWEYLGRVDDWHEVPATVTDAHIEAWVLHDAGVVA